MTISPLTAKEYRANAREMLGCGLFERSWLMSVLVYLVYSALLSISAEVVLGIGSLIIIGPLSVGFSAYFLTLSRTRNASFVKLFDGFTSEFVDNFLLGLMINLFTFLWSLLFIIPGYIKSLSYSMAPYIKNDRPELNWRECIDESRRMMDGNKWYLFCLNLSFIGWFIIGILTFGIGLLWVVPYNKAAVTSFYESIKE